MIIINLIEINTIYFIKSCQTELCSVWIVFVALSFDKRFIIRDSHDSKI